MNLHWTEYLENVSVVKSVSVVPNEPHVVELIIHNNSYLKTTPAIQHRSSKNKLQGSYYHKVMQVVL